MARGDAERECRGNETLPLVVGLEGSQRPGGGTTLLLFVSLQSFVDVVDLHFPVYCWFVPGFWLWF